MKYNEQKEIINQKKISAFLKAEIFFYLRCLFPGMRSGLSSERFRRNQVHPVSFFLFFIPWFLNWFGLFDDNVSF